MRRIISKRKINKSKSIFPPQNINIKSIEDRKISANDTEIGIRIFTDKEDTIQPLLVNFHGGGWVLGDLDVMIQCAENLLS